MLAQAIEAEVAESIERHAEASDEKGHRQVERNGYHNTRKTTSGLGRIEVKQAWAACLNQLVGNFWFIRN